MCLESDFRGAHLVTKKFFLFYIKIYILNIFLLVTTDKTCTFMRKMTLYECNIITFSDNFAHKLSSHKIKLVFHFLTDFVQLCLILKRKSFCIFFVKQMFKIFISKRMTASESKKKSSRKKRENYWCLLSNALTPKQYEIQKKLMLHIFL